MKDAYKIMSINVLGKYPKQESENEITESRMKTIAECVAHYGAHSVGLQEYGSQNKLFLPKYLPSEYTFVDFGQDWISTFYNTKKLTLVKQSCKRLTTSSNQKYCFTVSVFSSKQNGELAYIHGNLHLEYKDKETRIIDAEEINAVLTELFAENEKYSSLPLVITGDYNAPPDTEPQIYATIAGNYNIKSAADVADSAESGEATFHFEIGKARGAGSAIDHALVNCDTTAVHLHNVIKENDYPAILDASDHYPVFVEISSSAN